MIKMAAPVDIPIQHLPIVQAILKAHLPPQAKIWVFGSRAKWTTHKGSDLDLAIDAGRKLTPKEDSSLNFAFEECDLPFKVDVIDMHAIADTFKKIIETDKILLQTNTGEQDWREATLSEFIKIKHGYAFEGEFISSIPNDNILVTPGNFNIGGGFKADKFKYYHESAFVEYILKPNDLIVTMTDLSKVGDTLGYPALVPNTKNIDYLHNQRVGKVIFTGNGLDKFYTYYLMCSKKYRDEILASATGTSIKHTSPIRIESFRFKLPPLPTQRTIAAILGALDDKIELNRRMNATLEAMARALFKSWFIDFDPVRAKMEGRQPYGIDAETAALFPDSFVETELGLVPEGWEVGSISDICSHIINGGTPARMTKSFWENGSIPWYKTGELTDSYLMKSGELVTEIALEKTSIRILHKDSVLMAIYAAPTVGRLGILTEDSTFNQACTGMMPKKDVGTSFLFLNLYFGREWFNSRSNGAAQQNISKSIVESFRILIPSQEILHEFNLRTIHLFDQMKQLANENQKLISTRDYLLPKLISGEVRVSNL